MMELNLKLLGDLQVYDMPYLSLYADEVSHNFYLAFRLTTDSGPVADYVVTPVNASRLIDYLNQEITIRELFRESDRIFIWHKQRGMKGGLSISHDRQIEEKVDNSKYNPRLCEDEEVILDYLQGF